MNRTELREKLNKIDCENFNQYDLVNLFESVKLSNEDLNKLSEMVEDKDIHDFLYSKLDIIEESMSSAVERQTLGYKKTKGQIQCNGGEQAKEVEDLLKAKYDNVTTQKGKGGKVIIKFSKNESLGEGFSKDDVEWLKSHKGEKLNKGEYKVDYQEYFDNDNNPIGGRFTLYKRAGKHGYDRYAFKNEDELIAYIKRHFFDESLSESSNGYFAYHDQIVDALISRCQREGVLSTDTETLLNQLSDILGVEQEDIEDESRIDINELIAFCQRQDVLPTTSDELIDDLESLTDLEREDIEELLNESLSEDTVKQGSQWVNKGKEGTHGKFKTKKAADAQRKAMFAKGFSVNESVDPNTLSDDYVLLDSRARNHTDEDIDLYYDCIKEFCMIDELVYDDMEVTFVTNQRDADDWDEETYHTEFVYRPDEGEAQEYANDYLSKKYPDKITVGDIKKSADDVYEEVKDHFYEKAQEYAESHSDLADFREQLKEDKAKDTMKSVVAKWRSRRSNKE